MLRLRLAICCLAVLALVASSGPSLAQVGRNFNVNQKFNIEPGWEVRGIVEFTRNGVVIDSAEFGWQNNTEERKQETFRRNAPPGTNDIHYIAVNKPIGMDGPGPIVAGGELPTGLVADFAEWLWEYGYVFPVAAFQTPLAVADLNANWVVDVGDASLYARIDDPNALAPYADEAYFPVGSVLLTDAYGQLPGIPGLTFYMDAGFTIPYAEAPILVTGIAAHWVFP